MTTTKNFWAGLVTALAGLLSIFGIDVSGDTQAAIVNGISAIATVGGAVVAAISAWRNNRKNSDAEEEKKA